MVEEEAGCNVTDRVTDPLFLPDLYFFGSLGSLGDRPQPTGTKAAGANPKPLYMAPTWNANLYSPHPPLDDALGVLQPRRKLN